MKFNHDRELLRLEDGPLDGETFMVDVSELSTGQLIYSDPVAKMDIRYDVIEPYMGVSDEYWLCRISKDYDEEKLNEAYDELLDKVMNSIKQDRLGHTPYAKLFPMN